MAAEIVLSIRDISKTFPGIKALDKVSFELHKGKILGLVGENGAGKSTLIKILAGIYHPDGGRIFIDGEEVKMNNPWDPPEYGLGFIHQHLNMIPFFNVIDNAYLGKWPSKSAKRADTEKMKKRIEEICEKFNFDLPLNVSVKELSTAQQWMVQIIRAFITRPKILVMDEPTAALSDKEVHSLFEVVKKIKEDGVTIIYVSHRMNEIFNLCDEVVVLRNGVRVYKSEINEACVDELVEKMIGERKEKEKFNRIKPGEKIIFEAKNLGSEPAVKNVSFNVNEGEILAVYGLQGSGRTEIAEIIFGMNKKYSGEMKFMEKNYKPKSPNDAIDMGISLVPEDRTREGLVAIHSILDNLSLPNLEKFRGRMGYFKKRKFKETSNNVLDRLKVKYRNINDNVNTLSGGNQQKIVLSKWLIKKPDFFIFDEPTVGVDVGARRQLYEIIHEIAKNGKSVMVISSDLDEIMEISANRVMVMREGIVSGILNEYDHKDILNLCYGREK